MEKARMRQAIQSDILGNHTKVINWLPHFHLYGGFMAICWLGATFGLCFSEAKTAEWTEQKEREAAEAEQAAWDEQYDYEEGTC